MEVLRSNLDLNSLAPEIRGSALVTSIEHTGLSRTIVVDAATRFARQSLMVEHGENLADMADEQTEKTDQSESEALAELAEVIQIDQLRERVHERAKEKVETQKRQWAAGRAGEVALNQDQEETVLHKFNLVEWLRSRISKIAMAADISRDSIEHGQLDAVSGITPESPEIEQATDVSSLSPENGLLGQLGRIAESASRHAAAATEAARNILNRETVPAQQAPEIVAKAPVLEVVKASPAYEFVTAVPAAAVEASTSLPAEEQSQPTSRIRQVVGDWVANLIRGKVKGEETTHTAAATRSETETLISNHKPRLAEAARNVRNVLGADVTVDLPGLSLGKGPGAAEVSGVVGNDAPSVQAVSDPEASNMVLPNKKRQTLSNLAASYAVEEEWLKSRKAA